MPSHARKKALPTRKRGELLNELDHAPKAPLPTNTRNMMNYKLWLTPFSLSCFVSVIGAVSLPAGDWPGFRALSQGGVASDGEKPPVHFGASSNMLWKAELPRGHSSPAIWKDSIFVTGAEGKKLITRCLDRSTGKQQWEQSVTVDQLERIHSANTVATPTPTTDGHGVFVYFGSWDLLAYSLEGKELWRKPLPMPQTMMNQGTGTSPILADDKLIVFVQIGTNSHLLALNPKDGREIWKTPMPEHIYSYATPISWKEADRGCIGMSSLFRFTAFSLSDGKEMWWVDGTGMEPCSTPVASGNQVILSVAGMQGEPANLTMPPPFDESVKRFDRNGDGLIAFEEVPDDLLFTDRQTSNGQGNASLIQAFRWFAGSDFKKGDKLDRKQWDELRDSLSEFSKDDMQKPVVLSVRMGGRGDVTKSHVLWKETKGVPEAPSPLVWQGHIYLIRNGGVLACRDLETGKLLQERKTESRGGYFASPVLADGRIYVASDRGIVTVIKANDALEVLARNELQEPIFASPAIVGNILYVRSTTKLWAFAETPK